MVDKVIVACVQQRLRLHEDMDSCRRDVSRFLRMAQAKGAGLIVFPELAGMVAVSPLLQGARAGLLRQTEKARRPRASLWTRAKGKVAETTASVLGVSFRQALSKLLTESPGQLWDAYFELFSRLAREYGLTIVAGTGYFLDSSSGNVVNQATVFDSSGQVIGRQAKLALGADDTGLALSGDSWSVIETRVGRLGLLLGSDGLYPEAGRVLAYQGATMLIGLGAAPGPSLHRKLYAALSARVQENQLYGMSSFLVGHNALGAGPQQEYAGQSAIFAPAELTPSYSGLLVQVGTAGTEGVITAEWDFGALQELWSHGETPLRRAMPMTSLEPLVAAYQSGQTLHDAWETLDAEAEQAPALPGVLPVAELPHIDLSPPEPKVLEPESWDEAWPSSEELAGPGLPQTKVSEPRPPEGEVMQLDDSGAEPSAEEADHATGGVDASQSNYI